MSPIIKIGDVFLVNKMVYRDNSPKQGDIIVFDYPHNTKKSFVKRVIAKENDLVEIKNGKVYVNEEVALDERISNVYYTNDGSYGALRQTIRVPQGKYYVLGDNIKQSKDSRHWGLVSDKHIIGKAYKIIYPFSRSGKID